MQSKSEFLYIDPLKQGLKLRKYEEIESKMYVFIHRSIKTRIETKYYDNGFFVNKQFLYIDPLKQGLKHIYGEAKSGSKQ